MCYASRHDLYVAPNSEETQVSQFNFRIGNIEARTTHRRDTLEIVQWETDGCFTIVYFTQERDTSRWRACFCGDRPLHVDVDWKHLRELIQACYKYLNEPSLKEGDNNAK